MIKNPIYKLYCFAGVAFVLALWKYHFIDNMEPSPKFFVVEFLSFGLFIGIIYLFDRYIRECNKQRKIDKNEIEQIKAEANKKEIELEKIIEELKIKVEGTFYNEDEIDEIAKKVISNLSSLKNETEFANTLLTNLASNYELGLGICYLFDEPSNKFTVKGTYGLSSDMIPSDFKAGEGLNGQCAEDKTKMVIEDIDEDYFNIESCSGSSIPKNIYLLPIVKDEKCIGLIEIATFAYINIDKQWEYLNNYIANAMSL